MPSNYAQFCSRSHDAVIRVYDAAGNVIETHEHVGDFRDYCGFRKGLLRAQGQAELSLSGGNRFVSSLLTASSVIPVMPVCVLMVPNPGSRNEWLVHCDGGIHHVWPFKFGAELGVVIVCVIAPRIPRKKKKPAKQYH